MSKETLAVIMVLALHTVTRPDELGGTEDHPRGSVFEVEESELARLKNCGAVREATKEEIRDAKKGNLNIVDPTSYRSYADEDREASTSVQASDDAEAEADASAGAARKKSSK